VNRPPARLCRWTVKLALIGALIGPTCRLSASEPLPADKPDQLPSATGTACFGVLGAVACPGVYELPTACTFGQLVRQAGGMTAQADGNARVFRGARIAQQLFLASSDSVVLSPRDLVVVERRVGLRSDESRRRSPRDTTAPPLAGARGEEVQIGFLNLVDRPVVMTFAREQALPARILACLRQPAELLAEVRVVAPDPRTASSPGGEAIAGADLLDSGTVLIFPARRVQLASLPPLPDPIGAAQSGVPNNSSSPDSSSASPPPVGTIGVASDSAEGIGRSRAQVAASRCGLGGTCQPPLPNADASAPLTPQQERMIYGLAAVRGSALAQFGSAYRNVGHEEWERQRLLAAEREHARPYVFLGVLAGTAVAAILMTIGSMSLRWLNAGRPAEPGAALEMVPSAPPLSEPAAERRPIRVDATLSQTRLGLDLAIFERVRTRQTANGAPLSDPTPKAA
jgi:SLBB domain